MRWWLGRECFAKQKCILATKEEWRAEELEDGEGVARDNNVQQPPPATGHPEKAADPVPDGREGGASPPQESPGAPRRGTTTRRRRSRCGCAATTRSSMERGFCAVSRRAASRMSRWCTARSSQSMSTSTSLWAMDAPDQVVQGDQGGAVEDVQCPRPVSRPPSAARMCRPWVPPETRARLQDSHLQSGGSSNSSSEDLSSS